MATATITQSTPQSVLDAMRELHDEADRWRLADQLVATVPSGSNADFQRIHDDAVSAGIPALTVTSLRLYRDTGARWPKADRIPGVTFSAHREAQVLPSMKDRKDLLTAMVAQNGAAKVTVSAVRQAIAATSGRPVTAPAVAKQQSLLADLLKGSPKLIEAVRGAAPGMDSAELDRLHAGVSALLTEVEALRSKKARKSGGRKGSAPAAATKPVTPVLVVQAAESAPVGDLRDL